MNTLKSKGIVRKVIEQYEQLLVSFPNHDGYFNVYEADIKQKILEAEKQNREVVFTYDKDLNILTVV